MLGFARRALAIGLLALLGVSPVLPALTASDPESKLPACCRRDGKHSCGLAAEEESKSGPAFKASPCASYPCGRAAASGTGIGLPEAGSEAFAAAPVPFSAAPSDRAPRSSRFAKSHRLRGPPSPAGC